MITDSFRNDLIYFEDKLKCKENFSFSKYADGEFKILANQKIKNCDGWTFDPNKHSVEQKYLLKSFQYDHKDYFIGISCPCCQSMKDISWMRDHAKTKNLTWANLLVNGNFDYFKENFFPIFNQWKNRITLVANELGSNKEMPFRVDEYYSIKIGAFLNPDLENIILKFKEKAASQNDQLFLFSAGPLGNILAHLLHEENPNNTYFDIGSTINPWVTHKNRGYLQNNKQKICIW